MAQQAIGGAPQESSPRAVILLSEQRSGSTIFHDEFTKHPLVHPIRSTEHLYDETLYWIKAACLLGLPAEDFLDGKPLYDRETARTKLIDFLRGNMPDYVVPKDDEELIFGGWTALCKEFGPIFFEKSPQHIKHWAALTLILRYLEANPDSRVVGLVRNPQGMIYSAWSSWRSRPRIRQFVWRQSHENLLRFREAVNPAQFLLVRYEDLSDAPIDTMRAVCRFANLDYDAQVGLGVHRKSIDKWRIDPIYTLQLDESVKAVARVFGYTDADMENPRKPGARLNPINQVKSLWLRRKNLAILGAHTRAYPVIKRVLKKVGLWEPVQRLGRRLVS